MKAAARTSETSIKFYKTALQQPARWPTQEPQISFCRHLLSFSPAPKISNIFALNNAFTYSVSNAALKEADIVCN
jgi:hypothetical protein